jgi:hypothetical protein
MARIKKYQKCTTCEKLITGVEKWGAQLVYCCKCFRVIEKAKKIEKEKKEKDWYKPEWTLDEYYHYVFDHFC